MSETPQLVPAPPLQGGREAEASIGPAGSKFRMKGPAIIDAAREQLCTGYQCAWK